MSTVATHLTGWLRAQRDERLPWDRATERTFWVIALVVGICLAFTLGQHGRDDEAIGRALEHGMATIQTSESLVYFDLFGQERFVPCLNLHCRPS